MTIELFPFRLRDPLTGKWYKARWKATAADITKRGGEIVGPGEARVDYYGRGFRASWRRSISFRFSSNSS